MAWLAMFECSRTRFASALGISRGRVTQLLTSREEPSAHLIAKLLLLTNLPFDRLFKVVGSIPALSVARQANRAAGAETGGGQVVLHAEPDAEGNGGFPRP
ncbi:MAG: helix-turn-helix transcriptional regulator [Candidatus Omnitrophica bacterium]|nr:helix-turn-helix transcriptional regulator [Candidatus Omnitrophota bacterium]